MFFEQFWSLLDTVMTSRNCFRCILIYLTCFLAPTGAMQIFVCFFVCPLKTCLEHIIFTFLAPTGAQEMQMYVCLFV